jgi:methionine-S-sulfoxide reductase
MDYIIIAGGCFWGMEKLFSELTGVVETSVGYAGGREDEGLYPIVKTGKTNHAEAIKVKYDKEVISLAKVLEFFFRIHDPTTLNSQGNDIGSQYRSVIFYQNDDQKKVIEEVIKKVDESGFWSEPIVTAIEKESTYILAEDYHQKYLDKNPNGYTCHFFRK